MRLVSWMVLALPLSVAAATASADQACPASAVHQAVRALDDVARALAQPLKSTSRVRQRIDDVRVRLREACPEPRRESPRARSVPGLGLLPRLAGLWTGPLETRTNAGNFPLMNIDFRPVGGRALFGRTDLDEKNGIRLSFSIEQHGKVRRLIFRSRGLFYGFIRDSRSRLVEKKADSWRFCSLGRGCSHVDARFRFPRKGRLELTVLVGGRLHIRWSARRAEARPLPAPFPTTLEPYGTERAPFPPLPTLRVRVSWSKPLRHKAHLWVLLSRTRCHAGGGCTVSRSLLAHVPAGATSARLTIAQVHPGDYRANAILDRNRNWIASFRPDSGDGVARPNADVRVKPSGETSADLAVFYDMP